MTENPKNNVDNLVNSIQNQPFTPYNTMNNKFISEKDDRKSSYFLTVTSSKGNHIPKVGNIPSSDEKLNLKFNESSNNKQNHDISEFQLKISESDLPISGTQQNTKDNPQSISLPLKLNPKHIEITIIGYQIKNILFQHVSYLIEVKDQNNNYKLFRRYSEFLKLREMLCNKYIGVFIPSLPLKEIFRNREIALIEFRKKFLQIFLHELQINYFYSESEEIKAFLDPNIDNFPPDNLLILCSMKQEESILIEEALVCTREKVKNNYIKHQYSFILSHLNNIKNKLPTFKPMDSNYKEINPKRILSNIRSCRRFGKMLAYKKKFLENIQVVIKNMPNEYKEISDSKIKFIESMRSFQKNFIFSLAESSRKKSDEDFLELSKSLENTDKSLQRIEDNLHEKKSFYKLLKNLHDWIYKEVINIDSCIECIKSLEPFILKVKFIDQELNKLQKLANSEESYINSYINLDLKEKLEKKLENLKEIIAINSMFINEVELSKYKTCRFVYYYNCLKYSFYQNETYYKDQTMYLDCLQNVIVMIKLYVDNFSKN